MEMMSLWCSNRLFICSTEMTNMLASRKKGNGTSIQDRMAVQLSCLDNSFMHCIYLQSADSFVWSLGWQRLSPYVKVSRTVRTGVMALSSLASGLVWPVDT